MLNRIRITPRLLIVAAAFGGSIIAGPLAALDAHAAYSICRTDPIVKLSNGYQLSITESVADASGDIKGVSYAVHVPQGLGVQKIVYTGGALKGKDLVTVYADNPSGTYTTTSVVTTGKSGIAVGMTVSLSNSQIGGTLATGSASGTSGSAMTVQLQHA